MIAQCADDTFLTIAGKEAQARATIQTLEEFCLKSKLIINWSKSHDYRKAANIPDRTLWTNFLSVT